MAKKKRVPRGSELKEITQAQFNRATRNRRCVVVGANEGGATFKCGRSKILTMGHTGSGYRYYQAVGRAALDIGYTAKRRSQR